MAAAPVRHTPPPPPAKVPEAHTSKRPHTDPYYASVARRFRIAKYASVILLVVFLIFSFTFLRSDITLENLRYLLKFISFTNTETSITAPKISYASGEINRLELFLGDLCSLTPDGYAIYDSRGNQIMSDSLSYNDPVLKVGNKFALCYDMDGTQFTVLNTFSKLYEGTSEYPITDGTVASDGSFAIASSSREYRTAVTLYNSDFDPVTRIYKNDHLMGIELRPDASEIAVMTVCAKGGELSTTVELIRPGASSAHASHELSGIGYSLFYTDSGIAVLTDESICFLDASLEPIRIYRHESQPAMAHCSGKYFVCAYADGVIGNSYRAVIYDTVGKKIYEGDFSGKLTALDGSGDCIFILTGTTLSRINPSNGKIGEITVAADAIDMLAQSESSVLVCLRSHALTYELTDMREVSYRRPADASEPVADTGKAEDTVPVPAPEPSIPSDADTAPVSDSTSDAQ